MADMADMADTADQDAHNHDSADNPAKPSEQQAPGLDANLAPGSSQGMDAQGEKGSIIDRIEANNSTINTAQHQDIRTYNVYFRSEQQLLGIRARKRDAHAAPQERPAEMPNTFEKIDEWFWALSDSAQCMVRATAVLHGAPATDINTARQDIYKHLNPYHDTQPDERERAGAILGDAFTRVDDSTGVQRIYWQDTEESTYSFYSGYSLFGLRVLRLLAEEIQGVSGIAGYNILPLLEKWALSTGDGEHAERAAYALGVIWWIIDQDRLRRTVYHWANSANPQTRQAAAWMIFGAYEIEHSEAAIEHVTRAPRAPMMADLLRQWSMDILKPNSSADFAGVVITAYGLIGLEWPEVGLDGLDFLLGLTSTNTRVSVQAMPTAAFVPAALIYVQLAGIGHTRAVIAHLARHATRLIRIRKRGILDTGAQYEQAWRNFGLNRLYFIFFLLVASSLEDDPKEQHAATTEPEISAETSAAAAAETGKGRYGAEPTLPSSLPIPYAENLDTLLAGILAKDEETFRSDLVTLLTVALYHWNPDQVRQTLQVWGETIMRQRSTETVEASRLRLMYLNVLGALAKTAQELDDELGFSGLQSGYSKCVKLLQQWPRTSTASAFAEAILTRLRASDNSRRPEKENI